MAGDRSQGILGFIGLVAISTALGYGAWISLTRPKGPSRAAISREAPANDSLGFVSIAAEGVDLEMVSPDGTRTSTRASDPTDGRIARSEASVDCPGFANPDGKESDCTASIIVNQPAAGDYTVIARAAGRRIVTLNVGWATESQIKRGAIDVRLQIAAGNATSFTIIVARDAVSQRSEPRPHSP